MIGTVTLADPVLATLLSSVVTCSIVGTSLDIWKKCNLMSTSKSEGAMTSCNGLVRDNVDHASEILSSIWISSSLELINTCTSSSTRSRKNIIIL